MIANTGKCLIILQVLCVLVLNVFSQDTTLIKTINNHKNLFNYGSTIGFAGNGWDSIISQANRNQYFLIGEVHGINEVPLFINALTNRVKYETFVAEIDPFLNSVIQNKIKKLPPAQLESWYQQYGSNLSFYSYKNDFSLLKDFTNKHINVIGIDQITALNDLPVLLYLSEITIDKKRKEMYLRMAKTVQEMFTAFLKDQSKPPYLMSSQFQKDMDSLNKQKPSAKELDILNKLQYSRQIYTSRDGHQRRIKLMKNQLMNQYTEFLFNKKSLFRLGANHSAKGESFLTIYDIGNLVHNLAESQLNASYHVAIFAKSGSAGNPLMGKTATKVEQNNDLAVFYSLASDVNWTYFNLLPLRHLLERGKLDTKNDFVKKMIKGYDGLIIVPQATAAEHNEKVQSN